MLKCVVNPSIGFIIAGHQSMECRFIPNNQQAPSQVYEGALNMIGLNIGISAGGVFGWAVLAPTAGIPAGALAGEYAALLVTLPSGLELAPTCLSAALATLSRFSQFRWRARLPSTSPLSLAFLGSSYGRCTDRQTMA